MHVLVTTTDIQSIPLIVPAVGPPKIGTIADLALNPIFGKFSEVFEALEASVEAVDAVGGLVDAVEAAGGRIDGDSRSFSRRKHFLTD